MSVVGRSLPVTHRSSGLFVSYIEFFVILLNTFDGRALRVSEVGEARNVHAGWRRDHGCFGGDDMTGLSTGR